MIAFLAGSGPVFFGSFLLGESVVLAAAAMAGAGRFSIWAVAAGAFAGTVLSDTVWFGSAERLWRRVTGRTGGEGRYLRHADRLDRWTGDNPHRGLLFVKFVYGTRILSIAYLARRRVRTATFVSFDAIGTLVWLAVLLPVGFHAGRHLSVVDADVRRAELVVAVVVITTLVLWRSGEWLRRRRV